LWVILIWIGAMAVAALFVANLRIDTDMAAFLPRDSSPAQRVLVDQLRDGVISRLLLVAIEGVPAEQSTAISKRLAARLRIDGDFISVENGEAAGFDRDRDFLWAHRYLLSDQIDAARFTSTGLRAALQNDLRELGSTAGFLLKRTLAADPTGEMLHLVEQQIGDGTGPARQDGVWVSPDGRRTLLLIRLRVAGSDIDGAQRALAAIRDAFTETAGDRTATLVMTGPPVFAVEARDRIKSDATRLSAIAGVIVATFLLGVYQSARLLLLAFVPVVTGAVAGIAAVGMAFNTVHGITLGFGATLIGEGVDYAVYLFTQTAPDSPVGQTLGRIWPTLRLGVLTSIVGFSAMLLSSFEGFAQLGLFTITGLAVAVCVTRWVLPALLPARFVGIRQSRTMMCIATTALRGRRLRPLVPVLTVVAAISLLYGNQTFWADDLASLSPVPPEQQLLDQALRRDLRAAGVDDLIVTRQPNQQAALRAVERIGSLLLPVVHEGGLAGFDTPARYLPSMETQKLRQAALPEPQALRAVLDTALIGLPFQPDLFAPFLIDVGAARSKPPIDRADLVDTSISLKVDSLLLRHENGWVGMVSLHGLTAAAAVAQAMVAEPGTVLINLKAESNRLLRVYLREGISLASLGGAAIALLLLVSLRSLRRLALVAAPLVAAVVITFAALRLGGQPVSIFNLFGVLLVVAIGSNYCLFFDRQRVDPAGTPRVLASLLLANASTVTAFGVLAFSHTPVLHDLGMPVAIGTLLSLIFATIIMAPPQVPNAASH
jgi:predicted exporter